jgi:hypothetical protein
MGCSDLNIWRVRELLVSDGYVRILVLSHIFVPGVRFLLLTNLTRWGYSWVLHD